MQKMNKRFGFVLAFLLIPVLLTGCLAGPNTLKGKEDGEKKVAGFWKGLWHGFTLLITFIISLFNKNVNIYEVYNNGGWYNFGFLLGVMMIFGGGGAGGGKASCNKR